MLFPDPNTFLCILASAADAAAVNGLANGLTTFFINGNPVFSNGTGNLLSNPFDYIIFNNWVFDNLISVHE